MRRGKSAAENRSFEETEPNTGEFVERRKGDRRRRVELVSREEIERELRTSSLTNLPNKRLPETASVKPTSILDARKRRAKRRGSVHVGASDLQARLSAAGIGRGDRITKITLPPRPTKNRS
jgi:hypothetical protein